MSKSKGKKPRHVIEALSAAFLLFFQHLPYVGPWRGLMTIPLASYVFGFLWSSGPETIGWQIDLLFLSPKLMFGRLVAIIGFVIFFLALMQLLRKNSGLLTSGLYSVVRHPQYFGLSIMTLGTTIMCFQWTRSPFNIFNIWLIQVVGYILLAGYEERHLIKEYPEEYQQYKQKVSFLFLAPRINKIPEALVSLAIAYILAVLLLQIAI